MNLPAYQDVDAGQLRCRVTIQRDQAPATPGRRKDSFGQTQPDWQPVATVWAAIRGVSAKEVAIGQAQKKAIATHIVTIRHQGLDSPRNPLEQDRLLYRGRTFQVGSVYDPDERHVLLWLECTEVLTGEG